MADQIDLSKRVGSAKGQAERKRILRNNAVSAGAENVENQAAYADGGPFYSPRAAVLRGASKLLSIGSSDRARSQRAGTKAAKIKAARKKNKK